MSDQFNRPNPIGQTQQIFIKPSDTTAYKCKCGSETFVQKFWLRLISPLLGGDGTTPKPMGIIACEKCGKPVNELLPEDLQEEQKIIDV